MRNVLESAGKQIAHELGHMVVEAAKMPLLDGRVILVNDNDCLDPMMGVEHLGKPVQSRHHFSRCGCPGDNLLIAGSVNGAA